MGDSNLGKAADHSPGRWQIAMIPVAPLVLHVFVVLT